MSFIGLDKIGKLFRIIKHNGGVLRSLQKFYLQDELKIGRLVGEDKYGNKYFQNDEYFYGRNRWVEYPRSAGLEYDGSQVPAEWFGWLHYKTELPPTVKPPPKYKWMMDHVENKSGTSEQYVPYSTNKWSVESWKPPKKQ